MNDSDSKQAIPSPEDRVRARQEMIEKARDLYNKLAKDYEDDLEPDEFFEFAADFALSLVEELKGQVVSASPQPKCPRCPDSTLTIGQGDGRFWVTCGRGHAAEVPLDFQIADFAQFFAALLTKRKDYHAEYVEAVEAAEKAKRERDEYLETGQRIQGDFERAKEAYVCSERELGVMREALQEIASYEDEIFAKQIALKALTPEPASQEAKEKK